LQRSGKRSIAPTIHDVATAAVETKGAGEPVDSSVRSRTEASVGADLSSARVHRDADAQLAASAIGARAFTYGKDVFLGPDQSPQDVALMAHELTHVVQQGAAPAPQRKVEVGSQDDPAEKEADAVADNVVGNKSGQAGRIIDDGATPEAGQQTRSAFLAALHSSVTTTASGILGPLWTSQGCPYIEQWFARNAGTDAPALERMAQRYSGITAASAAEYIPTICTRLADGIRRWSEGASVDADLAAAGLPAAAAAAGGSAVTPGGPAARAKPAGGAEHGSPAQVAAELGEGRSLDAGASRVAAALGEDVSDVRIHTDAQAARLASDRQASAFTVGRHIAFGEGAYAPGTPEGDALLAHELAHSEQQRGADPGEARRKSDESAASEGNADDVAAGALARLYGGTSRIARRLASSAPAVMRSGFALQRCKLFEKKKVEPDKVPLPPTRADTKPLTKGDMTWKLEAVRMSSNPMHVEFKPKDTVTYKNISFVQTVLQTTKGERTYAEDDTASKRFEAGSDQRRVDHFLVENDPFYGAKWDGSKWVAESTTPGEESSPATKGGAKSAKLYDKPGTNFYEGEKQMFETVAVVMETGEPLGALKWGIGWAEEGDNPRELYGATPADCTDAPSADWQKALDKFYDAKFEAIVDSFDQNKSTVPSGTDGKLGGAVSAVKSAKPDDKITIELGGAADLSETDPAPLSVKRAEAVKAVLVGLGVAESKITVTGYGSDWARVRTTDGASEPKNRRVQVRVVRG
jgi:outer membrane protein OmpA-like peptidoglycan-associated protein